MSERDSRPLGVTLVFLLILVSGVLNVVAGIVRLFNLGDTGTGGIGVAIITIALGLIYLLVAKGIANGSRMARFLVAIVTVLTVAGGFWTMYTNLANLSIVLAVAVQILLGLAILALLYSGRARAFFRS